MFIIKAARLHSYEEGRLQVQNIPDPLVTDPHDVLVRVAGAGLCRTDLHVLEGVWRDVLKPDLPYTLGHETAGWVEEVGPDVNAVSPGDPVILHPQISCGLCAECRRGNDMYCERGTTPGLDRDGGFAELVVTSERSCIKLAEDLPLKEAAPLADAGLAAFSACKKVAARLGPGTTVVVIGIGGLGHIGIQCVRALTSASIVAVDTSPGALLLAQDLGVDHVVQGTEKAVEMARELTAGRAADVVIDFVGDSGTMAQGAQMLARGGCLMVVGYGGRLDIPSVDVVFNEITIVGSLVGTHTELSELMDLAATGQVHVKSIQYSLDEVNDAIRDLEAGSIQGRAVLVP